MHDLRQLYSWQSQKNMVLLYGYFRVDTQTQKALKYIKFHHDSEILKNYGFVVKSILALILYFSLCVNR